MNDLTANLTAKKIAIDIVNKNDNGSLGNAAGQMISPTLRVKIPKFMVGGIYDVTSQNKNQSSKGPAQVVDSFKIKETLRVTNVGDTAVDITLKSNIPDQGNYKLLIKGTSSALVQAPSRPIAILR